MIDTVGQLAAATPRVREAASVPFLHLLGIACGEGLLRLAAHGAGPRAARYAALADFHAAEAEARAGLLAERCLRADIDPAFDQAFAA